MHCKTHSIITFIHSYNITNAIPKDLNTASADHKS